MIRICEKIKMGSDSDDDSYIAEAERKAKQNYLTEEIIENNYDPELFMMFCSRYKEADIDAWGFEELQEIVHKFKMTYRRGQSLKEVLEAEEAEAAPQGKNKKKEESPPPKTVESHPKPVEKPPPPPPPQKTVEKTPPKHVEKPVAAPLKPVEKPITPPPQKPIEKSPTPPPKPVEKPPPPKPVVVADEPLNSPLKGPSVPVSEKTKAETLNPSSQSHELKHESLKVEEGVAVTSLDEENKTEDEKIPEQGEDEKVRQGSAEPVKITSVPLTDKFTIECKALPDNDLSLAEKLEFVFFQPELIQGGFFSKNYYLYPVKIFPMDWECKRRFSDYSWLCKTLAVALPGVFVPPIPPRKSRDGTEEEIVKKRRQLLVNFTSAMARNKTLLRMPLVQSFFTIANEKEFKDFKKNSEKTYKKPEYVEHFYTDDGKVHCDVTYYGPKAEKLLEFSSTSETLEKKLKRQSQTVMNDIKAMQANFFALSEMVTQLKEAQSILPYTEDLGRLYSNISSTFKKLSDQETQRSNIFLEYYNMYFKFSYLEKTTMKEMLKEREVVLNEYSKAEVKQKNVEKSRAMFGAINYKTLKDIERVIKEEAVLQNQHFIKFAHEKVLLTTELHQIWSELIENLTTI